MDIGYLAPDDGRKRVESTLDLILLVCEPLRHRGPYDFGKSDLVYRAGELSFVPARRRGAVRAPPPDTVFMHRKLVISFLTCARIRAGGRARPDRAVPATLLTAPALRHRRAGLR